MNSVRTAGRVMGVVSMLVSLVTANQASAQSSPPAPWVASDIGTPAIASDSSYSLGTFRVDAAGADIYGTSDQFHFIYQQITGDVEVIARVDSLTRTTEWSKAGVMIRASLNANAAHGFAHLTGGNGARFLRRLQTGAATASTPGPAVSAPQWVRIVRIGTRITAYSSANGTTWTTIGSDTVALGATAYVGLAVVSCNTSLTTSADISQVAVKPIGAQSLPAGQQARDIGAPAIAGSTSYTGGTYTVKAAGTDIYGTADQFHFVSAQATGDLDVKVRVASLKYANSWSKAGVMVRESLTAGSRNAFALVSAANGYALQRRIDPNGFSLRTSGGTGAAPGWVRLVRTGDRFEAFRSANGVNWTSMGSDTVPMAATVYVGIAVTSRNAAASTTSVLDSFSVSSAVPTPNQPPTVSLTSPVSGSSFTAPADVALTATAADSDGTLARVEFFNGSALVASDTSFPYSAALTSLAVGTYTLKAVAYDNKGGSTTSNLATITVTAAANKPPTVTLTAPANGATFTGPATIALTASASDPEGKMARVEFYNGSALLFSDTSLPYSFSWQSVAAGTYTVKAVAYDTAGASATSSLATITVTGSTSTIPTAVGFQASPDHATLVTSYRLDVFAAGANPNTATPVATSNLGKPTPAANGDITVSQPAFFSALAPGSYIASVVAVGNLGSTRAAPVTFTR